MSRGYTPRHAQTAGDLSFAVQFNDENDERPWSSSVFLMFDHGRLHLNMVNHVALFDHGLSMVIIKFGVDLWRPF